MKTPWRFFSGRQSFPSRGTMNRQFSVRTTNGRQFEDHVGRLDASMNSSDSLNHFSLGGLVVVVLLLVGLIWIGWRIIADTAGYNIAVQDPETALTWMPNETVALNELAFRELAKSDGDLTTAWGLAERALRSNPLDARALSALGLISERQGSQARADILMRLSGERTWRDTTSQAWLVNRNIQRGEFEPALSHIDALLRVTPGLIEQTFPVLTAFTIDKRTFDALASFIATAPPWRSEFLAKLSNELSDTGRLMQLYSILKDSQYPPNATELRPYLDRLIRDGRFAEAYKSWRETLPPKQRTSEVYPYNGDFSAPIDGLPFNWLLRSTSGMDIKIVASPGDGNGRALQFQFSGARVADFTVGQLMVLPPGEYRLTGKVRAEELRTQRGIAWQISCAESSNNSLAHTNLVAAAMPWTSFSVNFVVPVGHCRAQWLNLEIPSRTASERQVEGQVWYENLQIVRVPND